MRLADVKRPWRHPGRLSFVALAIGLGFIVWYFGWLSTEAQDLAYQIPGMLAPIAIVAGVVLYQPDNRRPWILLAVSQVLMVMGDWAWVILEHLGLELFPSIADALYLSGQALTAVAVIGLVRGRIPGGDRAGLIDALVVAVGAALLTWTFLIAPLVTDPSASMLDIGVALAYPALDVLLLGVLVRIMLAPGHQVPSLRFLLIALILMLAGDFPYAFMLLEDTYHTGDIIEITWLAASGFYAAAALHPSMREVARPTEASEGQLSPARLAMLAAASLMAPTVLVVQGVLGEAVDIPVIATGCVVLFLLVIARLGGLVKDLRATLQQRRSLEEELEHRALHDPLTGLPNRALFYERLEQALRHRSEQVAVLFLDLDDFKTVNDTFGHQVGDELLRLVGDSLRHTVRASDTVARLGGDEFAILVDRDASVAAATSLAGRVLTAVGAPKPIADRDLAVGTSIGISVGASGDTTAERLMREADVAMYVAKSHGKSGFSVFDARTHDGVVRTMGLQADLERGIREGQFELHYQPIISLESGEIAGIEALVRWRHPTRGLLLPGDFIHLAEMTGAIVPLDRWVIEEASRQSAAWGADGPTGNGRFLSVNLSPLALVHPGLVDLVASCLKRSGLAPRQLMLEITESAQPDPTAVAETIAALKVLGVRLAIDDFGTGFASISRLLDSPFDVIKIDEGLLQSMKTDARAGAIVSGVLDLGRRLGSTTIAEGVEDASQVTELRQLGCDYGQGFHFSAALTAEDLEAAVRVETAPAIWSRRSQRERISRFLG
jgi:diguanylate cyclase (GGDEF)-like protein